MTKQYEYREVTEVWDGVAWVKMPSFALTGVFIVDNDIAHMQELVAKHTQPRKEDPVVGEFGPVYLERREVSQWEKL